MHEGLRNRYYRYVCEEARLETKHISKQRLTPYLEHSFDDEDGAVRLYQLDRRLSAELFYEIGIIEVALRNAVDRYLSGKYGETWISNLALPIDHRTSENFHDAWESLPAPHRAENMERNKKLKGRILAASMFRTWSNLFDKGGPSGFSAPRDWSNHDLIWTAEALKSVFPGAARLAGRNGEQLNRDWVHRKVKEVHVLRNRIAHHESLINGYPLPGQENVEGTPKKMSATEGFKACRTLAKMIDGDLARYLEKTSEARDLLTQIREASSVFAQNQ